MSPRDIKTGLFGRVPRVFAPSRAGNSTAMEHEEQAREMERDAEEMEEHSEKVGEHIEETRRDWKAKEQDPSVPGAQPDPDQSDQLPEEAPPGAGSR